MAKFVYRMQNILNIKYKLEDQAKTEFMIANRQLQEEENKLQVLNQRKSDYEMQARELLIHSLQVNRIRETQEAIIRMEEFIIAQTARVQDARRIVEKKEEILSQLRQERKAQEKLKEKAFENFVQEENAKESKEIDELVSFTYGKRRREE